MYYPICGVLLMVIMVVAIICIALGEFHHNYMEEIEDIRQELNKKSERGDAEGDK